MSGKKPESGKSSERSAAKVAAKKPAAGKPGAKAVAPKAVSSKAAPKLAAGKKAAARAAFKQPSGPAALRGWMEPPSPRYQPPRHKPAAAADGQLSAHYEPDARARAILRGQRVAQEDLRAAGGTYDLEQVQEVLHQVSRQSVAKRVSDGSLLAVPGPNSRRRYPTFQFNLDGTLVEGIKDVQRALPSKNAWAVLNFLANPDPALGGRTPMEVLRDGEISLVVAAASSLGDAAR